MGYAVYFQLLTNGCIEVDAQSYKAAQALVQEMEDRELLENSNDLILEFTDKDGFLVD
jgi:murein L,D-transpeptidase YafK